jgi:Trk K+ transport system NAD-binding subunit
VVGCAVWGSHRIIEELLSDTPLRMVLFDSHANFAVYKLNMPENWHGRPLQELLPEDLIKVLAWTRAGQHLEVSRTQSLAAGDLIYLSVDEEEIEALRYRLGLTREGLA